MAGTDTVRRRFDGRVVLVVGAGRPTDGTSNGAAAAIAYAAEGGHVWCADVDTEAADRTAAAITDAGGHGEVVHVDATDDRSVAAMVEHVVAASSGRVDVLHNNVGAPVMGGVTVLDEDAFDRATSLNLGSVARTCRAVLPHMVARRAGAIVNISSIAAVRWTGYAYVAYAAAKAAVNRLTVEVAIEHARDGVRANAVMPGMIDTPLVRRDLADQYASEEAMQADRAAVVPLQRLGRPEDVAAAALFLASDDASFVTGVCLAVDGGQSCSIRPPT